jgi:hypothetical protein
MVLGNCNQMGAGMTGNEIHIGNVKSVGGLNQSYQDIEIIVKLGDSPKIGSQMILKDNITNKIVQRPVQIMFNENELNLAEKYAYFILEGIKIVKNYRNLNGVKA